MNIVTDGANPSFAEKDMSIIIEAKDDIKVYKINNKLLSKDEAINEISALMRHTGTDGKLILKAHLLKLMRSK